MRALLWGADNLAGPERPAEKGGFVIHRMILTFTRDDDAARTSGADVLWVWRGPDCIGRLFESHRRGWYHVRQDGRVSGYSRTREAGGASLVRSRAVAQ